MKKILLCVLFIGFAIGQFKTGTISAGSLLSYTSYDAGKDSDYEMTIRTVGENAFQTFNVKPTISYFLQDNLSIDAIVSFTMQKAEDDEYSQNGWGVGFSHYLNQNIYLGLGYISTKSESEANNGKYFYESKQAYMEFHGGYLAPLSNDIFLNFGFTHLSGIGDIESELQNSGETTTCDQYDDGCPENDQSIFSFNIGIRAFFSL